MESPSKMALSFFKYIGVNVEDSVLAQIPVLETPAVVAHMDMEGVASMDVEGVLQDSLQKFKKEVEDVQGKYFAGMARAGLNLKDSCSALVVVGARPHPDAIFECLKKCLDENQRKMTKFFEDEVSALTIAAAPVLKPLASTVKPAGEPGKDERKTAEADAVPLACSAVPSSSVEGATRRRPRRKRRLANVVPSEKKGPTSDIRHGTIVGINHEKKFAFIRTSRDRNDFYVGQQQFDHRMAMGDEVSFCELEPCGRRRRCPGACHVDLLARAWSWYHRPYHGARKRSGS